MVLSDNIVSSLDISDENVSIFDLHLKLALESIVNVDRGSDVGKALRSAEIGLEGNGNRGPPGRIDFNQALGNAVDDSSGSDTRLIRVHCAR